MDRISFINRVDAFFMYNKNVDKAFFDIENQEAEDFYQFLKTSPSKEAINRFILSIGIIKDFLEKTENYLLDSACKDLNIEYSVDEYALSDEQIFKYNIVINPNELYDYTNNSYYDNGNEWIDIYRLENNGNGIYNEGIVSKEVVTISQPRPSEDGDISYIFSPERKSILGEYSKHWFFAFKNIEQLEKWFDFNKLDLTEYIKVYKVKKRFVLEGNKQVAFKKSESHFLGDYCSI